MNRQRIFEIISAPENIKYEPDLPIVKELIESFPYFPTPHIILAKLLYDENSIYFDKNLKLSAAYIGNREILYHYLKDISHKTGEKGTTNENPQKHFLSISQDDSIQTSAPDEGIIELIADNNIEDIPTEIATKIPAAEEGENISTEMDLPVEQGNVNIKEILTTPDTKSDPGKEIFTYASYDYLSQFNKEENNLQKVNEPLPIKQQFDIPDAVPQQAHSFSDWFDLLETKHKYNRNQIEKYAGDVTAIHKNTEVISLIDKFIQTEPRIKPQQTKMYKPEDMAKQSAKEDLSIATETLANIYLKQGLNHKAIEIFQQLILKYPQKSGYFANRIREIESEGHS
jgi:tetratricopeptide (TPR) repeat protein